MHYVDIISFSPLFSLTETASLITQFICSLVPLSRGTVVLPLPAVSGEKICELVADNDGDGKVSLLLL